MATIPTDEEMGLQILKVWEERNLRAGDHLNLQFWQGHIARDGWRKEDFDRGCQWLAENGYIVANDRGNELTQAGSALLYGTA